MTWSAGAPGALLSAAAPGALLKLRPLLTLRPLLGPVLRPVLGPLLTSGPLLKLPLAPLAQAATVAKWGATASSPAIPFNLAVRSSEPDM
jgi:hypothetical protein